MINALENVIEVRMSFYYDCFLSYNWNAKVIVTSIYSLLTRNNLLVWMDDRSMSTGNNLSTEISKGIKDAKIIICFLTLEYSKSEMCQCELNFAKTCKAEQSEKVILPILLSKIKLTDLGGIGLLVSNLIYFEYENSCNDDRLVKEIKVHLSGFQSKVVLIIDFVENSIFCFLF